MNTMRSQSWAALALAGSAMLLSSVNGSAQAQGAREYGGPKTYNCIGYEHRDFKGAQITQNGGGGWKYVGGGWNDKISSFRMSGHCRVVAYHHRDYRGESTTFSSDVRYVGDMWNDQISSWKCLCN